MTTDLIPATAEEAVARWDAGETLFSVEMGGLGPGYEMAIQGLAFELMRGLAGFDAWEAPERFAAVADPIISRCNEEPWGVFSGAQVGAAQSLAAIVCRRGYRAALDDPEVRSRLIQVNKRDLRSAAPTLAD